MVRKGYRLFVVDQKDGSEIELITSVSVNGTEYVKTKPNDTGRDNLLSLKSCI